MILDPYELTPIEKHNGIYLKRDDLFMPFGENTVNGGKLRQCYFLVDKIKDKYEELISCCSIYSPQAPITAAVGKHFGKKTTIYYGGTTKERLLKLRMPYVAERYGAGLQIVSKSGRHSILYQKAKQYALANNAFVVDYGFNIMEYPDILVEKVAKQVENLPNAKNLIITCGSGITSASVLLGLKRYNKDIENVYLVSTAPNRKAFIDKTLIEYGAERSYTIIDFFHQSGFVYEKGITKSINGIKLHPQYEAKAYAWLEQADLKGETIFWIVGAKPMR